MKKHVKIILWAGLVLVAAYVVWRLATVKTVQTPEIPSVENAVPGERAERNYVAERMSDPVYVEALKGLIDERRETIAEAHAVRRQMGDMLMAAEKVAGASSSGAEAEKVAGASSSGAEAEPLDGAATADRELEAPATMAATADRELEAPATMEDGPVVWTNTALQAGAVLPPPEVPAAAWLQDIPPALLEYVRQQPDWEALETRLGTLATRQQSIQARTQELIRERMVAQVDPRRQADGGVPTVKPPAEIKYLTNMPPMITEPTVITNLPDVNLREKLPPVPVRTPVK